jgi:PAS domain S-box-containing protein
MAKILVVDDRPSNRDFLKTLLGYQNHRVVEAADGAEALALARSERPELVITDILMPTMDGYEFIHRLRSDPEISGIPVIFNTAHFLDREARALARKCRVSHIIHKPSEPEAVLRAVGDVLGLAPADELAGDKEEESSRAPLHVFSRADELKFANERLDALIHLGHKLAVERSIPSLLESFCRSARKMIGAKYAVVGMLEDGRSLKYFLTSGMRADAFSDAENLPVPDGLFLKLLKERKAIRLRNVRSHPRGIGVPQSHPDITSFLGTAISSPTDVYGAFYVGEKIGLDEFTKEDEELVVALAAQLGVTYESARRFEEVQRHTQKLDQEIAERTRVEKALRASEQRFSKAFSASPIPMSIVSHEDGRYIDVNESFLENSGYTRDEIVGKTTLDIGIYADVKERDSLREVLAEHGRIRNAEVHRRTKSGEPRVALTSSEIIEIDGVQCVLTANNDITDRKRAEEARQASQMQLASIIGSAMDAIITVDSDQRIVLFNASAESIFDCPRSEAIGQPLDRFIPERFRKEHHQHIRNFGQTNGTTRAMGSSRPISGIRGGVEEFPIEASISQVEVDGQKLYTVIIRDITQRKLAEEEIARKTAALEQHSRLLDLAQVLVRNPTDSTIILWNKGAEDFYGWTKEEALGRSSHELFQTEFPKPREAIDADILRDGFWEGELTHTCHDGRRVTVASHQVLQRNEHGEPIALLEVNNDITDRRQAERKLAEHALRLATSEEALRAKNEELQTMSGQLWHAAKLATVGELAASIAHELNNPLATVSLRIDSLLSQVAESDPTHKPLSIVAEEVERMGNLVSNLLQFSRRKDSQVSTIDCYAEIRSTLELLHNHLRNRNIQVSVEVSSEAQMVQADRQQLRQVFLNVLTNAADAMPDGGLLTIRCLPGRIDRETNAMLIEVVDTGKGIPEADLPNVTEPFFTTKPEGMGTGLGLAICKRIVQEHRGIFEIRSEVGKGTTVSITLPVSAENDDSRIIGGRESVLMAGH